MPLQPLCKLNTVKNQIGGLCVWERYFTITLGWLEVSNKGVIIIADAETDAKEDGDDKKSDDNNDVSGTSLDKKKGKRKDWNRTTAKRLKKKKEKEGNNKTDN